MSDSAIPEPLKRKEFRFVKVRKGEKRPFEPGWQKNANYRYDSKDLRNHIKSGGNYGLACGYGNLVVIDCDKDKVERVVLDELPETFQVRSGSDGSHFYYICEDLDDPIRLQDSNGNIGDVQSEGKQAVGPGSKHPNGCYYEVENDKEIAEINASRLREALSEFLNTDIGSINEEEQQIKASFDSERLQEDITEVIDTSGFKRTGDELRGPHPIHGSKTGTNLAVNPEENKWRCFRHDSGGDILYWIAVKEGIITCSEARSGGLRGEDFKRAVKKGREVYNLSFPEIKESKGKYRDEKGDLVPQKVAESIKQDLVFKTSEEAGKVYWYKDGYYRDNGETKIREEVEQRLGSDSSRRMKKEVISSIKDRTRVSMDEFEREEKKVNLKNGIYDLEEEKLLEHDPEYLFLHQVPVRYDEEAKCPKIRMFISELVSTENQKTLQEMAGFCLQTGYKHQKAFLLVGEGSNGKSTFLNLLREFLGDENIAGVPLQRFSSDKFAAANLYGKKANINSDLPDKTMQESAVFKQLTGEDRIYAEEKYEDPFEFYNEAKLIFSTNSLPQAQDDTDAFYRRWVIIPFPNRFTSKTDVHKDINPDILKEIAEDQQEMSGMFNWALKGLKRLESKGEFTSEKNSWEMKQKYRRVNEPVKTFLRECVNTETLNYIPKQRCYREFMEFCRREDLPSMSKLKFFHKMKEREEIEEEKKEIDDERVNCYRLEIRDVNP